MQNQMQTPSEISRLRHGIRGILNAMSLGVCALQIGLTVDESLEFLGDIERSAGELSAMLDAYEPLVDATMSTGEPATSTTSVGSEKNKLA